MEKEFKSTHDLAFEVAAYYDTDWTRFRIGTCTGLWRSSEKSYEILVVENSNPGNGHFEDVLEWFENSCKRDGKTFRIREVWNEDLAKHLLSKRGFVNIEDDDYLKTFD